jgi:hypothetical protein
MLIVPLSPGKYEAYPELLKDEEARQNLIDEWAAPIGESIVANWNFSEDIQATLNPDEVETTRRRSEANLADIVTTAKVSLNGEEPELHDTAEAKRLQLTEEQMPAIMESYQKKLDSLASAVRYLSFATHLAAYRQSCNPMRSSRSLPVFFVTCLAFGQVKLLPVPLAINNQQSTISH